MSRGKTWPRRRQQVTTSCWLPENLPINTLTVAAYLQKSAYNTLSTVPLLLFRRHVLDVFPVRKFCKKLAQTICSLQSNSQPLFRHLPRHGERLVPQTHRGGPGGTPLASTCASFSCSGIQDNERWFKARHAFTMQAVKPCNCEYGRDLQLVYTVMKSRRTRTSQDGVKVQGTRAITNGGRTKASTGVSDRLGVQHLAREEDTTPSWSSSNRQPTTLVCSSCAGSWRQQALVHTRVELNSWDELSLIKTTMHYTGNGLCVRPFLAFGGFSWGIGQE